MLVHIIFQEVIIVKSTPDDLAACQEFTKRNFTLSPLE